MQALRYRVGSGYATNHWPWFGLAEGKMATIVLAKQLAFALMLFDCVFMCILAY